jgi:GNAT superfamily N-acetyltransferase
VRLFRPYPRISLARPAEGPELSALYARCWARDGARLQPEVLAELTPGAAEVGAWFRGGFEVYRASFEGELAGVVRISFPTGTAMLDRLAVLPERRRQGVGRALLEHAVDRGRKAGVTRAWVQLSTQLEDALELHLAVGFRESHRRPAPGGELVLLELPL